MKPKANRNYNRQPSQTQNEQKVKKCSAYNPVSSQDQNIICTLLKKNKKKKQLPQITFMINKWNPKQTEIAIDNLVKYKTSKN